MLWDSIQQPDHTIVQAEPVSKGKPNPSTGGKLHIYNISSDQLVKDDDF